MSIDVDWALKISQFVCSLRVKERRQSVYDKEMREAKNNLRTRSEGARSCRKNGKKSVKWTTNKNTSAKPLICPPEIRIITWEID